MQQINEIGKRNYQENQDKENDDLSKRRLSKNKENSGKRENDLMPKKQKFYKKVIITCGNH